MRGIRSFTNHKSRNRYNEINNIKDEITRQEKPFEVYYLVNGSVKRSPSNNKIVAYHITKIEKIEV